MDSSNYSRSQPTTAKDVNVKLKPACLSTMVASPTEQDTSFYEIDIYNSFEFFSNKTEQLDNVSKARKETPAKLFGIEGHTAAEEPLKQSCYPNYQNIAPGTEKPKSEGQTHSQSDLNNEKKSKKAEEGNNLSSNDFRSQFQEQIKNYIIENFFSKSEKSAIKAIFENYNAELDNDRLHLHHHEHHHHHHYYFANQDHYEEHESENRSSNSQGVASFPGSNFSKNEKAQWEKNILFEKMKSKPTYHFRCPHESNLTFTKNPGVSSKNQFPEKNQPSISRKVKHSEGSSHCTGSKLSTSLESIFNKKSDFITTHIYSDTELTKGESEEAEVAETFDDDSVKTKESQQSSSKGFNALINLCRSLSDFESPVVITGERALPKMSFIRCECTTSKSLRPTLSDHSDQTPASNLGNQDKYFASKRASQDLEDSLEETGKIKNNLLSGAKRRKPLSQFHKEALTARLKVELNEIKKDLKRIEDKHLKKKRSLTFKMGLKPEPESVQKIAVYSNKTFILGAEDLFLKKKLSGTQPKENTESSFSNRQPSSEESKVGRQFGERRAAERKKLFLSKQCHSGHHQTHYNRVYVVSDEGLN